MTFDPQNDLERALMRAANDPAARPHFYQTLLESDLYAIQQGIEAPGEHTTTTLGEGQTLHIASMQNDGKEYLVMFTSVPRISAVVREEVSYIGMNARELLTLTRGADIALNPGSEYGKIFTAHEVAVILGEELGAERRTTEEDTEVMIGQPRNYPRELADALTRFFERRKEVRRAWIAHFYNPADKAPPHTLLVVDAETEDWDALSRDIGTVAGGVTLADPPLDVMPFSMKSGLADYFLKESKPFFERKAKKRFGLF